MTPSQFAALDAQAMTPRMPGRDHPTSRHRTGTLPSNFGALNDADLKPARSTLHDPARPATTDALWSLLQAERPDVELAQRLGQALMLSGLIDREALHRALELQRQPGPHRLIGRILVDQGALSEADLRMALARWLGVRVIDPRDFTCEPEALKLITLALAERESVLPLMLREGTLVVLLAEPWDRTLLDELHFVTQQRVMGVMAVAGTLVPAIQRAYSAANTLALRTRVDGANEGKALSVQALATELRRVADSAPARDADVVTESDNTLVRMVNTIIHEAIQRRASDIHIETADAPREVRVRLRIDGELVPLVDLPAKVRFALIARLKIMADLDIAEHRKPQDGKIDFARFGGAHVELRIVTVPTSRGLEDVVMRLLSGLRPMPLDDIGLSQTNLKALREVATRPYGLILICGPTGCGKTTTLHSVLRDLNTDGRKIWTAEDPIEITQEGLRQVQMNPRIGWTFANAMRTFLRADPDVIMIGEMRDEETARVAVEASLTGHLVLSTLHTNSAPESITRLLEIGLDPFNFSDSLLAILAQRLVRRLCTHCREPHHASDNELDVLACHYLGSSAAADPQRCAELIGLWRSRHANAQGHVVLYGRRGCAHCDAHGYHGRLGIHELMVSDDAVRAHIRHRECASVLQADALAAGMNTLRQDGIDKVLAGLTDLPEILAATSA